MNKLVEREAFIDSVRVKSAEFQDFYGFLCFLGVGKTAYRHVLSRVVREIEMVGKWFRRVFLHFLLQYNKDFDSILVYETSFASRACVI